MSGLPINWLELVIDDIATVVGGGTPKANDVTNFEEPGKGIAWLTPADLSKYSNKYISHGKRDLSQKGVETSAAKLMPKGAVVFSSRAPIGYVAVSENEIATNQGFKSFVFTEHVDASYAYYYLRSIKHIAESRGTGTTFKELSGAATKKLPFLLAPLNEQIRIANKLDTLLAKVEVAQTRLDKIPNFLKRFRQSVLAVATSGELTKEWRKETPTEWQSLLISDVAEVKGGKRLPKGEELIEENTGLPYIRAGQLKQGTVINTDHARSRQLYLTPEIQSKISRYTVSKGDIYLTIVGASIGDSGVIPGDYDGANLTENAAKLTEFKKPLVSHFLAYWLRSNELQGLINLEIKSGAQGKLALKRIKELPVPYTNISEQKEIVRRVESLFTLADTVEKQYNQAKQRTDKLTQSILAKAFRGELVPQDPNDERADKLLERIRAQRNIEITPKTKTIKKKGKTKVAIENKTIINNVMPKSRAAKPKETVKQKIKYRKVTKPTSNAPNDINDSSDSIFDRYEPYTKELYGLIENEIGKNLFSLSELMNKIPWPYEQTKKGLFYLLKGDIDNKITPFAKLEWSDEYMIKLVK